MNLKQRSTTKEPGKPDAGNPPVRFDEGREEDGHWPSGLSTRLFPPTLHPQSPAEPFVAGADTVISRLVERIPNARTGFKLIFSAIPFPGAQLEVTRTSAGDGQSGTYYRAEQFELDAWLCPALLHYFPEPPPKIFAKAEPLAE